ncbi:hypothetical protein ASG57_01675 [Bradyrhizobium sp. Leaf396]|nr:hypothetical protein ASG57_01675 [Bradyrhizobium sp. Leaf396]
MCFITDDRDWVRSGCAITFDVFGSAALAETKVSAPAGLRIRSTRDQADRARQKPKAIWVEPTHDVDDEYRDTTSEGLSRRPIQRIEQRNAPLVIAFCFTE